MSDSKEQLIPRRSIRLHIKVLVEPKKFSVDEMLVRMREVYDTASLDVELISMEKLSIPVLDTVTVGSCKSGQSLTIDQKKLFANRTHVRENETAVYFVGRIRPAMNGCAVHPRNIPGAVVRSKASKWTLAHEVGHVLGLYHDGSLDRLMTGDGTDYIRNEPADLVQREIDTMRRSKYTFPTITSHSLDYDERSAVESYKLPDDVIAFLKSDEPDYEEGAKKFGPEILPTLDALVTSGDLDLLEKAVYFASLVDVSGERFARMGQQLKNHPDSDIRASVADGAENVDAEFAVPLILELLDDCEVSVRKSALLSVPGDAADSVSPELKRQLDRKLREVEENDPVLGDIARQQRQHFFGE